MATKQKESYIKFEVIWSPIKDDKMNSHLNESPIWKGIRYKPEEVTERIRGMHPVWYEYVVKFNGLQVLQMTKFREI